MKCEARDVEPIHMPGPVARVMKRSFGLWGGWGAWVLGILGWSCFSHLSTGWICAFALPRRDLLARGVAGQGVSNDILSRSGSSTLSNDMAVLAFIADTTTPNGKALVQLVTETDATETLGFCWLERSGVTIDQES